MDDLLRSYGNFTELTQFNERSLNNTCIVTSTTPGATMDYKPLETGNQDFGGPTLAVTCTMGATSYISIESGLNDGHADHGGVHALTDGAGHYMSYNTYSDPGYTQVWGSSASGETVRATADGTSHSYQIFVRIPGGQPNLPSGDYNDTLTLSVTY